MWHGVVDPAAHFPVKPKPRFSAPWQLNKYVRWHRRVDLQHHQWKPRLNPVAVRPFLLEGQPMGAPCRDAQVLLFRMRMKQ